MRDFLLNTLAPFVRKYGAAILLILFSAAIVVFIVTLRDRSTPSVPASPTPVIGGPEPPPTEDPPPIPTWDPGPSTLPAPPARRMRDGGR